MGSNPGHGKVFFLLAFFLIPSSSLISSTWFYSVGGVSRVVPLTWQQLPAIEKGYRDKLVTARGDLSEHILAAPSVG